MENKMKSKQQLSTSKKKSAKNKAKFRVGEKVLCFQRSHLYEAKCIDIKFGEQIEYLIHYCGWKQKYDEWVTKDRILKLNENNLRIQQNLRETSKKRKEQLMPEMIKKKEKLKKSDSIESNHSINHQKNLNTNNIKVPVFVENHEDFLNKNEVKIRIPEDLKTIVTDDWELIINQKKLVHLPFEVTINELLNQYLIIKKNIKQKHSKHTIEGYVDFITSLRKYFNYFLDKCLLYPKERQQMEYLIANYKTLTSNVDLNLTAKKFWKKCKIPTVKNMDFTIDELPLMIGKENGTTAKGTNSDQNSQSETSDSCTSFEISNSGQQSNSQAAATTNHSLEDCDIDFTKLYGPIHLLRLFTKMGQFLFYSDLNSKRLSILNSYISEFLKFLSKNLWLFCNESDTAYIDENSFINYK